MLNNTSSEVQVQVQNKKVNYKPCRKSRCLKFLLNTNEINIPSHIRFGQQLGLGLGTSKTWNNEFVRPKGPAYWHGRSHGAADTQLKYKRAVKYHFISDIPGIDLGLFQHCHFLFLLTVYSV